VKFVHAADLHLDSPLSGLERYEGAPVDRVRGATRRALEALVDLCLSEPADFLLLAGDLFDGDWKDYGTGLFFVRQMTRLRDAGIPVYLVRGNHDAASHVTKHLRLPEGVHELDSRRPVTLTLETHGVAIHGQSFATRAVTDDLAARYPAPRPGVFNIGLLHTCADGRPGHDPYAPCTVASLAAKGYDYWALGHVHAREVLSTDPWIVFPGNLQGRHARELGPKGATVVTVEDGRVRAAQPRALDAVRWLAADVAADDARSVDDVLEACRGALDRALVDAEGRLGAVRVTVRAAPQVHRGLLADPDRWTQQVRALAIEVGGDGLWVERVRFTRAERPAPVGASGDLLAQFSRAVRAVATDEAQLAALGADLDDLRRKLPAELREGGDDEALRLDDPATLRRLLEESEALVLGRLGAPGRAAAGEGTDG
jgi:DNA repair exonuclease SbcCD nuclease subunit